MPKIYFNVLNHPSQSQRRIDSRDEIAIIYLQGLQNNNMDSLKNTVTTIAKNINVPNASYTYFAYPSLADVQNKKLYGFENNNLGYSMLFVVPILAMILIPINFVARLLFTSFVLMPVLVFLFVPVVNFHFNIKKAVDVTKAIVFYILKRGIHPDRIFLFGNSIGGGIAAEVFNFFDTHLKTRLKLIVSNSFTSLLDLFNCYVGKYFEKPASYLVNKFKMDLKPKEIIKDITPYTICFNRLGDALIKKNVQLTSKLFEEKREEEGEEEREEEREEEKNRAIRLVELDSSENDFTSSEFVEDEKNLRENSIVKSIAKSSSNKNLIPFSIASSSSSVSPPAFLSSDFPAFAKEYLRNHCLLVCSKHGYVCPNIHNELFEYLISANRNDPRSFGEILNYFVINSIRCTNNEGRSQNANYDFDRLARDERLIECVATVTLSRVV